MEREFTKRIHKPNSIRAQIERKRYVFWTKYAAKGVAIVTKAIQRIEKRPDIVRRWFGAGRPTSKVLKMCAGGCAGESRANTERTEFADRIAVQVLARRMKFNELMS